MTKPKIEFLDLYEGQIDSVAALFSQLAASRRLADEHGIVAIRRGVITHSIMNALRESVSAYLHGTHTNSEDIDTVHAMFFSPPPNNFMNSYMHTHMDVAIIGIYTPTPTVFAASPDTELSYRKVILSHIDEIDALLAKDGV